MTYGTTSSYPQYTCNWSLKEKRQDKYFKRWLFSKGQRKAVLRAAEQSCILTGGGLRGLVPVLKLIKLTPQINRMYSKDVNHIVIIIILTNVNLLMLINMGASQVMLAVKNLSATAGAVRHTGSALGLGTSSGGGHGNPLHYCLENPTGRGAWWATGHRVTKSWTQLKWLSTIIINIFFNDWKGIQTQRVNLSSINFNKTQTEGYL